MILFNEGNSLVKQFYRIRMEFFDGVSRIDLVDGE